MIKIAIAEDQSLFGEMLAKILMQEPSFIVTGCVRDGDEIEVVCEKTKPDVVLLDIKMSRMDGISALALIKKRFPFIKVILLTTFEEEKYFYPALVNGMDGYIIKDTKPEILIHMIQCVYDGLFVVHESMKEYLLHQVKKMFEGTQRVTHLGGQTEFDPIDLQVLRLLSCGKNNAEIAEVIKYSEGTVKNRISKMLEATGCKDRTQLAIFSLQSGIV